MIYYAYFNDILSCLIHFLKVPSLFHMIFITNKNVKMSDFLRFCKKNIKKSLLCVKKIQNSVITLPGGVTTSYLPILPDIYAKQKP